MNIILSHPDRRVQVKGVKQQHAKRMFIQLEIHAHKEHGHPGYSVNRYRNKYHEATILQFSYNEHNPDTFTPMDYLMAHVNYNNDPELTHLMIDYDFYFYLLEPGEAEEEFGSCELFRQFVFDLRAAHKNRKEVS